MEPLCPPRRTFTIRSVIQDFELELHKVLSEEAAREQKAGSLGLGLLAQEA